MRKSSYVKIGAFVCAAILLAVVAVVLMGSGPMHKRELLFETYVEETVQGVSEGSALKYRGIPVGSVKSISFATYDYTAEDVRPDASAEDVDRASRYARIVLAVDTTDMPDPEEFQRFVEQETAKGLRAHMKSQGITGLVYVDCDYEDPGSPTLPVPWNPKHPYIPMAPSLSKTLTDAVQGVAQEIRGFADVRANVTNLAVRIASLVDNANAVLGDVPALVAAASNAVASADAFLRAAKDDAAPLPGLLSETSNLVVSASAFLDSVKGDVADVVASSTNFLAGADDTVAGLRTPLESTLDDLSRASRNLADILDAIRDDPGRLFQKPAEETMP
jgi:ABC-type transporter Mla subunit MlaD